MIFCRVKMTSVCLRSNFSEFIRSDPHTEDVACRRTKEWWEVMQFWIKRREKLIHHYSLVGYLLSPNPTIKAHAYDNRSDIHNNAVVKVITKLIIDPMLVEDERSRSLAESINTFWDEYGCFVNKQQNQLIRDSKKKSCEPNSHSVCFIGKRFCHPGYTGDDCSSLLTIDR